MLGRAKPTSSAASASRKSARPAWRRHERVLLDDAREHVEVRVADGVAAGPPLQAAVAEHEQRQREQAEQEPGAGEAHPGFLAQIAWICSWTRTPVGRVMLERTVTRTLPSARGGTIARTEPRAVADGALRVANAIACDDASSRSPGEAGVPDPERRRVGDVHRLDAPDRAPPPGPGAAAVSLRVGCGCAIVRPRARRRRRGCSRARAGSRRARCVVLATNTAARPVVTPGPTGPPSVPRKAISSAAARGRRRARRSPGRARGRRAASTSACRRPGTCTHGPATGMHSSRPLHSRPAIALAGAIAATAAAREQDGQPPDHGSLPKRNADMAPAASNRTAPPAAKAAVISRFSFTCPTREPRSS